MGGQRTTTRNSHLILCICAKTEVCTFDCADSNDMETNIPICANMKYGYLNSDNYLQWHMINDSIYCVIIGTTLTV